MQQVDVSHSATKNFAAILARGCVVFLGGTISGYLLLSAADGVTSLDAGFSGFFSALGDALSPTSEVSAALGNTMYLASATILAGIVFGACYGGLLRLDALRSTLGALAPLIMAVSTPGVLLFPLAWGLIGPSANLPGPLGNGAGFAEGNRFVAVWGGLAGLSLAAPVGAWLARQFNQRTFGLAVTTASLGARTEAEREWLFGLPTTALLVAIAAAEVMSNHAGLFSLFQRAVIFEDMVTAFGVVVVVVAAATIVAVAVDIAGTRLGARSLQGPAPKLGPVRTSAAAAGFFALFGLVAIAAGAGYGMDTSIVGPATDRFANPSLDGPLFGTDALGRSIAKVVAEAIGPSMIFSILTAAVAMVLAMAVALVRRGSTTLDRILGIGVDFCWWPSVLFIPLASIAMGSPDHPEFHVGVLALSGLAMTPFTSRLIGRSVLPADSGRSLRTLSSWLFMTAVVFSVQLVAGFMGLLGGAKSNLGMVMATGVIDYRSQPMTVIVPAVVSALIMAVLLYLASSVAAPAPAIRSTAPSTDEDIKLTPTEASIDQPLPQAAPQMEQPEPAVEVALPSAPEVNAVPTPPGWAPIVLEPAPGSAAARSESGSAVGVGPAEKPEPRNEPAPPVPPTRPVTPRMPSEESTAATTAEPSADLTEDADVDDLATRTVELRPSTVRLAVAEAERRLGSDGERPVAKPPGPEPDAGPE